MNIEAFAQKYQLAVRASDHAAMLAGYREKVDDAKRLQLAELWRDVGAAFDALASEVTSAIVRASVFIGDVGTLTERVGVLKESIQKAGAAEIRRAQERADKEFKS